jgi:myo-inositol 2-dehydrogenase/D-chiro-inositol 1-dehydrogenase
MTVNIGIIGTGVMGADHARLLGGMVSGATVGAVFDVDRERASAAVAGIPTARVLDDPLALIKDTDIDAVLIASSDETHERFVLACLGAGKPVLCEKPLAPTAAACLRLVDAEVALGRRLVSVGFMRRYDDGYLELKRTLDGGLIGRALLLHCVHRNIRAPDGWPSDMLITASAVHEIDISHWLLGEEIVAASCYRPRRSGLVAEPTQDPQFLVLETDSGVLIDVEVFVNARYGYDVRCELVCEEGAAALDEPATSVLRRQGAESRGVARDWRDRFAGAYRAELQDWVDGIVAGEARGASAWDGYAASAVAESCVAALQSGRRTDVQLDPRLPLYD